MNKNIKKILHNLSIFPVLNNECFFLRIKVKSKDYNSLKIKKYVSVIKNKKNIVKQNIFYLLIIDSDRLWRRDLFMRKKYF